MTGKVELLTPSGGKVILDPTNTAVDRVLTLPAVAGTVFNQGNVVGTVSQSSGVPTGSIIERGSNANGQFVKYADGTMICERTNSVGTASSIDLDDNVLPDSIFAATFIANPTAAVSVFVATDFAPLRCKYSITGGAIGNSSWGRLGLKRHNTNAGSQGVFVSLIAIGRWF